MRVHRHSALLGLSLSAAFLAACSSIPRVPREGQVLDARNERGSSFERMVDDLESVRMVFVGESHTSPEHHEVQRRIIDDLSRRNPHLIVGLEMLQRPYQEVLDRWSAGTLTEGEFLREVSWFDQWSDWHLYAPILRLCRDRHLKVVGLHLPQLGPGGAISRAISKGGLENLPPWMRAQLPDDIDLGVRAHERAIRKVFFGHPGMAGMEGAEERFLRFYQSQCSWDETMAESTAMALRDSPHADAAIVVLAGSMHVMDFEAMPERARRRNGLDYRTVLPMDLPEAEEEPVKVGPGRPADWVVFTGATPAPSAARLGVGIRGGDNLVTAVSEGGAAAGAGMKAGDFLGAIDDAPVKDVVDVKRALDGRAPGQTVRLRWTRDGAVMEGSGVIAEPAPMFMPPPKKAEGEGKDAKPAEGGPPPK